MPPTGIKNSFRHLRRELVVPYVLTLAAVSATFLVVGVLHSTVVDPRGTFSVARADEALGLVLLLFTALVTAQLADGARRGTETAREAAVARRSDELKTALLRAVTHNLRTLPVRNGAV